MAHLRTRTYPRPHPIPSHTKGGPFHHNIPRTISPISPSDTLATVDFPADRYPTAARQKQQTPPSLHTERILTQLSDSPTANMSLTNCRFYEEKFPEIDSFVMVNVKQVWADAGRERGW